MGTMPKKNSMTIRRALSLALSYVVLCVAGGVVASLLFLPAVFGANTVAKAVMPSLQVEGIDFDVTSLPQQSRMYASDGSVIATFYSQNRIVVPIKDVSEYMQKAIVAREDRRFFEHSGVDVQGVMRAFVQTYIAEGDTQGGSSLTQQYVKNVLMVQAREDDDPIAEYHAQEQTIARKLREMLIAVQMEKMYSKPEILQGYLNIAQFGSNNLYGVETAAHRYFNVSAKDLNLVQSATIAAITKNPSEIDPSIPENQERAQDERDIVLQLMLDQGLIEQAEYDEAVNTPLVDTLDIQSVNQGCQSAGNAGFFCAYVTTKILNSEEFGETEEDRQKLLNEGGLDIYTTMDVEANNAAMQAANDTIPADDPSGLEVMIAAIKPGTGEVLGFGINRTYDELHGRPGRRRRLGRAGRLHLEADQHGGLDAAGTLDQRGPAHQHPISADLVQLRRVQLRRRGLGGRELRRRHREPGNPAAGSDPFAQHHPGVDGLGDWSVRDRGRGQGARLP